MLGPAKKLGFAGAGAIDVAVAFGGFSIPASTALRVGIAGVAIGAGVGDCVSVIMTPDFPSTLVSA
jgi:hypothetical protein